MPHGHGRGYGPERTPASQQPARERAGCCSARLRRPECLTFSAVREPAVPPGPTGLTAEQVVGEQQDSRPDDGGDPGGQVEEPLQAVDVEQLGGDPAAQQGPGDANQTGQDETLRSSAGDQHIGEQACSQAENNPCDDAHNRLL